MSTEDLLSFANSPKTDYQVLRSAVSVHKSIMLLTETWAKCRSKDPNTKVGCCIYDPYTGTMLFGYNGFPKGIADTEERWQRPTKYDYVIHAEENALLKAVHSTFPLGSAILYCTHKPCHKCMGKIIQAGIKTVYYKQRHDDSKITDEIAREADVALTCVDDTDLPF